MRATRTVVYAMAAASPAYLLVVHLGGLTATLLEVLTVLAALTFTIESLITAVRPRWPGAFTGPLVLIGAAVAGSIGLSATPGHGLGAARVLFLAPAVIFGIGCSVMVTTQQLRRLAGALLLGGTMLALSDLVSVAGVLVGNHSAIVRPPVSRVALGDSALLVPIAALALALLISSQGQRPGPRRLPAALSLTVCLPAIALSLGRTGWLTLALAAAAIASAYLRRRLVLVGVIIAAALALVIAPIHASISEVSAGSRDAAIELWTNTAGGTAADPLDLGARGVADLIGLGGLLGFAWFALRVWRWVTACLAVGEREHRALAVGGGVAIGSVLVRGVLEQRLLGDELGMIAAFGGTMLASVARLERIRLRSLGRMPWTAGDIEPAELPMPADIPRKTGRHPRMPMVADLGDRAPEASATTPP